MIIPRIAFVLFACLFRAARDDEREPVQRLQRVEELITRDEGLVRRGIGIQRKASTDFYARQDRILTLLEEKRRIEKALSQYNRRLEEIIAEATPMIAEAIQKEQIYLVSIRLISRAHHEQPNSALREEIFNFLKNYLHQFNADQEIMETFERNKMSARLSCVQGAPRDRLDFWALVEFTHKKNDPNYLEEAIMMCEKVGVDMEQLQKRFENLRRDLTL